MTRHTRVALFLHVVSSLLQLGAVASHVSSVQTQLDTNRIDHSRGPFQQAPALEGVHLPADLTGDDGLRSEGETLPLIRNDEVLPHFTATVIDHSGRLIRSQPSPDDAKQIDTSKVEAGEKTTRTAPTKKTVDAPPTEKTTKAKPAEKITKSSVTNKAPNKKQANQTQAASPPPEDTLGAPHTAALIICIAALACIFSFQWKSNKRARETSETQASGGDTTTRLTSSGSSPPGSEGDDGTREAQRAANAESPPLISNEVALQGLIFLALVIIAIGWTRLVVCNASKLQCDGGYTIQLFFRQDFHKVVLDMFFVFIIGRLAQESALPLLSVQFAAVVFICALVPSFINEMSFTKHALSMYDISCGWTAMTFVVAFVYAGCILSALAAHFHHFFVWSGFQDQIRAIAEVVVSFCIFVLPRAFESGFHMHHWFGVWLLALGCRLPGLWSRGAQAFLIGSYINGIAVYGRGPVLACESAYDLAYSQQCKFLTQCTINTPQGAVTPQAGTWSTYMAPDWRTCNAGDYAF